MTDSESDLKLMTTQSYEELMQVLSADCSSIINSTEPIGCQSDSPFTVSIDEPQKRRKSMPWSYSIKLNRLYAAMEVNVPVKVSLGFAHREGLLVRVTALFSDIEHRQERVKACPAHAPKTLKDLQAATGQSRDAWIHCENDTCRELRDSRGHDAILVPMSAQELVVPLAFRCRNTCVGGPNRRKTFLTFSLETYKGEIISVHYTEVKVVSCPGRDRQKDESVLCATQIVKQNDSVLPSPHQKEAPVHKPFHIRVENEQDYQLLAYVSEAMRICRDVHRERRLPDSEYSSHITSVPSPDSGGELAIKDWLSSFGCEAYADNFSERGLTRLSHLSTHTWKDLEPLKIGLSDRMLIWRRLLALSREYSLSSEGSGEGYGLHVTLR